MNHLFTLTFAFVLCSYSISTSVFSQDKPRLTDEMAVKLSQLPMNCIGQEYPNKTAHVINNQEEARLTPQQLHPAFYGCFDWYSSVHGHWMLVRLLKIKPTLKNRQQIIKILNNSFTKSNLSSEAEYFTKYDKAQSFERTYGWAWILKLDEELATWNNPLAKKWHANMQPLTRQIVRLWNSYLPNQTYPNRTGVHPNSAFAMGFAIDWARAVNDTVFERQLVEKSKRFYLKEEKTPAYLEPDGSDFFSPSLEIADLMRRILDKEEFVTWIGNFYETRSVENISRIPIVSDINDYQIVHLIGLSLSKSWCMRNVAKALPDDHPLKQHFTDTSVTLLDNALPSVFKGNYGGEHWLASFAVMALETN